jgi:hypothetical protein
MACFAEPELGDRESRRVNVACLLAAARRGDLERAQKLVRSPQSSGVWLAKGALLLATQFGCAAPSEAHPTERCDHQGHCPTGLTCHAGFCIAPELAGQVTSDPFTGDAAGPSAADAGAREPQSAETPSETSLDEGDKPAISASPTLPSAQTDAGVSAGKAPEDCFWGPCCPFGLTLCGDACVDVRSALGHCGKCDRACKPGWLCLGGECCGKGELLCEESCVNPLKDKHNCGSCGHECEHGPCKDGMCRRNP